MAHHQKHQTDARRRSTAMQSLLKIFNLSTAPTVPLSDEEMSGEADEPPEEQISPTCPFSKDTTYSKSTRPVGQRRESLLTRALAGEKSDERTPRFRTALRGLSTTSSHSTGSMASTAELTSDGDLTSPSRSATPSPPPPVNRLNLLGHKKMGLPPSKVVIAPITKDDKLSVAEVGEAAVEKTLGRKRCIMFACGGNDTDRSKDERPLTPVEEEKSSEPPKRKCTLTFACPTRTNSEQSNKSLSVQARPGIKSARVPSPAPLARRKSNADSADLSGRSADTAKPASRHASSPKISFHEFGSSHDETDAWVDRPHDHQHKLTLDDCMQKENRIRQIGQEAEEEAEEEEREQEELENELDDTPHEDEDDFAPSDEGSDGGNESDDEGGFASSDDESDAGSEYQFWAPSTTTAATSTEHLNISHFSNRQRDQASSVESLSQSISPLPSIRRPYGRSRPIRPRAPKMRPGTPELPDSTDFVCGTLDEDRPLEAAYISCREQRAREKHVTIPQDIDPSFPTTDPEDEVDVDDREEEEDAEDSHGAGGPQWMKDQFTGFEEDGRGRHGSAHLKSPSIQSPTSPPVHAAYRRNHRSPPPPKQMAIRSPPARKLFGRSPARLRSPPPVGRLRSPRGSPTAVNMPTKLQLRGLAQRPANAMERTASLPHTPNPFFRNFNIGSPSMTNIASGAVTPAAEEPPRPDMHVRGPVDIVIGLEKKRQKRKEKYWRQHSRKAAKEQAERKPVPGRGAERMKELGLECAERNRGYGLGQQTQLVISL